MFKGQPKGLFALALANTGERFGYYTMLAIFVLFIQAKFGYSAAVAGQVYSIFLAAVYFMPLIGGILADKIGYGKCVTTGIGVMFLGYACLAIPTGPDAAGKALMFGALALIAIGTGLFKGNLQVMVGNLYDDPKYSAKRDSAFSLFYMAINVGSMFAPTAAKAVTNFFLNKSQLAYDANIPALAHQCMDGSITALLLVFAVVIFFWMAFHQNGMTMTFFARDYTANNAEGIMRIGFNIWSLVLIAASIYTLFGAFQSESKRGKIVNGAITLALWGGAAAFYFGMPSVVNILPSDFQQFNPFYVVALTPVSLAIFSALANKGKEPSAPRKIGLGMFVAAAGFLILAAGSLGLASPKELGGTVSPDLVSPYWLISTYLVLTFAELLLSPMGISFVSKVAPPKYKGMMMGCWFAATAIGNYLVSIPALLWDKLPLWGIWTILIALCLVSAIFIFAIMKKLEAATK